MTTSPCYCRGKERAMELRYFCCINLLLFYKQQTVTNVEANIVTSDALTTDLSLLVCKHPGKLGLLFNQKHFLFIHCFYVTTPAGTTDEVVLCACAVAGILSHRNSKQQGQKVGHGVHNNSPSNNCSYRRLSCLNRFITLTPFAGFSKNPYSLSKWI